MLLDHVRPIYELLRGDERVQCWFSNSKKRKSAPRGNLLPVGVSPDRMLSYRQARRRHWDLIVYPDHDRRFRSDSPKLYIGHGLLSGKMAGQNTPYDFGRRSRREDGEPLYDRVFKSSPHICDLVSQGLPAVAPRLRSVGHLLAAEVASSTPPKLFPEATRDAERRTVMLISSWGPASIFGACGRQLLDVLPGLAEQYNVILALHPNLFNPKLNPDLALVEQLRGLASPHIYFNDDRRGSLTLLPAADLLVTDFSSSGLFFSVLARPILFVDNPGAKYAESLSLIPELRKYASLAADVGNLGADIARAFREFDHTAVEQLARALFGPLAEAVPRHREEIYELLQLEDARVRAH